MPRTLRRTVPNSLAHRHESTSAPIDGLALRLRMASVPCVRRLAVLTPCACCGGGRSSRFRLRARFCTICASQTTSSCSGRSSLRCSRGQPFANCYASQFTDPNLSASAAESQAPKALLRELHVQLAPPAAWVAWSLSANRCWLHDSLAAAERSRQVEVGARIATACGAGGLRLELVDRRWFTVPSALCDLSESIPLLRRGAPIALKST